MSQNKPDLKVTYNPQPGDPQVIVNHGVTMTAGEPVTVKADHEHYERFKGNPTFSVEGQDPPEREDINHTSTEQDAIIARLTAAGQKVDRRKGLAALQEQEAEMNAKAEEAAAKARKG